MNLQALQADPAQFRASLKIDADGKPVPLGSILDPWQANDFTSLDQAWHAVVGFENESQIKRAYLERPRGHSKTSDLAVMATYALFASRRKVIGYAAAADTDQAKLLRDSIEHLVRLNPWLSRILKITQAKVTNTHTGSSLTIISSDAPTSYGLLPDFVICDEITHWKNEDLWHSLISSAAKRANCLLVVISNAGFGESWQWQVRETIRKDPSWLFRSLDGPQASWITKDRLEEQRRLLPDIAYERLWLNRWTKGVGDALSENDIHAALTLSGPLTCPEKGWVYFAGLDLGLSRDRAALALLAHHNGFHEETEKPRKLSDRQKMLIEAGVIEEPEPEYESTYVEGTGRLKLAHLSVWNPKDTATGKVDIEEIEETIAALDRRFQIQVGCDPWQAAYLIERLRKRGIPIEPVHFSGENLKGMCSATLEAFTENNIDLYEDPLLLSDLRNLKVIEKNYGVRLDSPRGINGHGDSATALALGLFLAKQKNALTPSTAQGTLCCFP